MLPQGHQAISKRHRKKNGKGNKGGKGGKNQRKTNTPPKKLRNQGGENAQPQKAGVSAARARTSRTYGHMERVGARKRTWRANVYRGIRS